MEDHRPDTETVLAAADRVCTPEQIAAVQLYEDGLGYRQVARRLGIGVTTARDRLDRAYDRINHDLGIDQHDTEN